MPYITQWVDPDLFLEHQGVSVWHTYKEQEYDDPLEFWFTANPDNTDSDFYFDVRKLATYTEHQVTAQNWFDWKAANKTTAEAAIRAAIEQNILPTQPRIDDPSQVAAFEGYPN